MEQQDKRLENLHQQASTLYLQGEYVAALEAWRQLLKIDPTDERAREGFRLCELLVREAGGVLPPESDTPPPPAPAAAAPQQPAVGFGIGEDLDEELDELDELLGEGGTTDWMEKAPQQAAPADGSPPAANGPPPTQTAEAIEFDLSDVPEETHPSQPETSSAAQPFPGMSDEDFNLDGADRPAPDDAGAKIDAAFNFDATEVPAPQTQAPPTAPAPGSTDASAEELQRRTDELMAEALEHYEQGERADALAVLDRLAILDENNEAAKTFAKHIRAELEAHVGEGGSEAIRPAETDGADEDADVTFEPSAGAGDLPADPVVETPPPVPPAQPATPVENGMIDLGSQEGESLGLGGPEVPGAAVAEEQAVDGAASVEEFDLADAVVQDESPETVTPATAPEPVAAAGAKLPMKRWLMVAACVLLLLGGGYVALQLFGGSEPADSGDTDLATPPPLLDLGAVEGQPDPALPSTDPESAVESPGTPAVPLGDLDEVLDRAEAAYEDGNYAAAVLAYNEALKIDPRNEVARRRLEEAGEAYREQKDQLEQRATAIQAFNDGDYRNALRILYRLPAADEAEAEAFERYKFNGWYNIGVRALKTGDCRLARSNLREAQQVDPTDSDLQHAMELSGACFEGQSESYFDATRSLRLRALDD